MNSFLRTYTVALTSFLSVLLLISCKTATTAEIINDSQTQSKGNVSTDVQFWNTTSDKTVLFQRQNVALNFSNQAQGYVTITVDTTQTYQSIDGFGYALTGGSATLINSLDDAAKTALLKELFQTDSTFIGVN